VKMNARYIRNHPAFGNGWPPKHTRFPRRIAPPRRERRAPGKFRPRQ
jgi:hypothetical protein